MMLCYLVAALLLQAIMYVAVVQMALGARAAPAIAHFAFGTLEWRMFRAFARFHRHMPDAGGAGFCRLGAAALKAAGRQADPAQMGLIFYGVIALAMPRFFALLPAIVVARKHAGAPPRLDAVGGKFLAAAGGAGWPFSGRSSSCSTGLSGADGTRRGGAFRRRIRSRCARPSPGRGKCCR